MLNFQIAKRGNTVVEKYTFPVLTINPRNTQPKGVQKFEFNKAAVEKLKLSAGQYVGLAFTESGELVIVNLDNREAQFSSKVNKDFSFNSGKIFDKLVAFFDLDDTVINEMTLSCYLDEEDDYYYASMNLIGSNLPESPEEGVLPYEPQTPTDFFSDIEEEDGEFINELPEYDDRVVIKQLNIN